MYFKSNVSFPFSRSAYVVPTAGAAVTCGKPTRLQQHRTSGKWPGRIWKTTLIEVVVGIACRTVVIRLFRLHVLYSELVCPFFIRRTHPLCLSVLTDTILRHACILPFFPNGGNISQASLGGICGGRSESGICFCSSI
jgi:hypothetical protein